MKRLLIYAALVAVSVSTVHAETRNRIYQWNNTYNIEGDPTDPNTDYLQINQGAKTITIVLGITGQTFVFEARTEELQGEEWVDIGPGDINQIEANAYAGDVTITILPSGTHTYGAANVKKIIIRGTGIDGVIAGITISGNLATDGDVMCNDITGDIDVAGSFGDGPGELTYDMTTDTGTGDISIGNSEAGGDCVGDLDLGAYAGGEITINGLLLGNLEAGNPHDVTISGAGRVAHPSRSEGWGRDFLPERASSC